MEKIEPLKLARFIDHTLLKPQTTRKDIVKLCEEAKIYGFFSVCVNPYYVSFAKSLLEGSNVKVCSVVGFPLGNTTSIIKVMEAKDAISNGADEIDMVVNIGAIKDGDYSYVLDEIKQVREAIKDKILKVIIETAYLTKEEKIKACEISKEAGADFVKTSTGFAPSGATIDDIKLMREVVGDKMGVKASGGIRDYKTACEMINAGATRLGTSSSVLIVSGSGGKSSCY